MSEPSQQKHRLGTGFYKQHPQLPAELLGAFAFAAMLPQNSHCCGFKFIKMQCTDVYNIEGNNVISQYFAHNFCAILFIIGHNIEGVRTWIAVGHGIIANVIYMLSISHMLTTFKLFSEPSFTSMGYIAQQHLTCYIAPQALNIPDDSANCETGRR